MFGDQGNDNKNTEYAFDLGFLGIARLGWADCVHRAIDGKGRAAESGFFRAHSRDLRLPYDRMSTMRISSCWELIVSFW